MKIFKSIVFGLLSLCVNALNPKIAMYWVDNPISPVVPLESLPTWIDIILIGFATINSDSTITFLYNQTEVQNGIQYLKSNNQSVFISIGGAFNCGNRGISQDLMFGQPNFNPIIWSNSVKNFMDIYDFNGIDIDYECRDNVLQNPVNVKNALIELRKLLPNISISFFLFSIFSTPNSWQNYLEACIAVEPYVDIIFWGTYNRNLNPVIANAFYSSVNYTTVTQYGYNTSSVFYGYCVGQGCVWGNGPDDQQILSWATDIKNDGGGLFLWSVQDELLLYNISYFNTFGISKQVADILHA